MIKKVIFFALIVFCIFTYKDYSISPDEYLHIDYGELVYNYLTTFFQDKSFKTYHNLKFYGGWLDLVATVFGKVLNIEKGLGLYYLKHLITALIGVLGCYGTYLLSKKFVSEKSALCSALLLFTATAYNGQLFYNPKDIPFAAGYIFSIYYLLQYFEKSDRKNFIFLIISIGLTLGIRAGGVLLYLYFVFTYLFKKDFSQWFKKDNLLFAVKSGVLLFLGSYFLAALAWPYLLYKPFKGLYESILVVSNFGWDGDVLFSGRYFFSKTPPWNYLPQMFAIKSPALIAVGFYGLPLFLLYQMLIKKKGNRDISLLIVIAIFPIFYAIMKGSTVYNGIRQFLFTLPLMVVLAVYFWEQVIGKRAVYFFITQVIVSSIAIYQYYPYQYIVYNEFVGGTKKADGKYELEYWSMSRAEAAKRMSGKTGTFFANMPLATFNDYLPKEVVFSSNKDTVDYRYVLKKSGNEVQKIEGYRELETISINGIVLGKILKKTTSQ